MTEKEKLIKYFKDGEEAYKRNAKECYLIHAKALGLKTEYQKTTYLKSLLDSNFAIKYINIINLLGDNDIQRMIDEYDNITMNKNLTFSKRYILTASLEALEDLYYYKKTIQTPKNPREEAKILNNKKKSELNSIKVIQEMRIKGLLREDILIHFIKSKQEIAKILCDKLYNIFDDKNILKEFVKNLLEIKRLNNCEKFKRQKATEEEKKNHFKSLTPLDLQDPTI